MKFILPLILTTSFIFSGCQADAPKKDISVETDDIETANVETVTAFDAELAKSLEADPYGMHSYVFVTIKTGPNDALITDETERAKLFEGHFANMTKWAEDGKLVLAGPFGDAPPLRGLFIFDVDSIDEAKELVKGDPTVTSGIFELEYATYYGSAALKKVNDIHATIQEKKM